MSTGTADQVGMLPVPSGTTANFDLNRLSSLQVQYIVAFSITLAAATVTLAIRLYTRISIVRLPSYDDIATCLAWMASIISSAVTIWGIKHGYGRHMWEVTPADFRLVLKTVSPVASVYCASTALTKLSVLILLHRLNPNRWFRIIVYLLGFITIAYTVILTTIGTTVCSPITPSMTSCESSTALWQAVVNIITDVAIIILPMPMIYRLSIPIREKIALTAVLSAGIGVVVVAIVRITYVMSMQKNPDITYSFLLTGIWSVCEINIAVICNCVVVIKPFLRRHFPKLFSTHSTGLPSTTRYRNYGIFSNHTANTFHLTSVSNTHQTDQTNGGVGKGSGITVTNSYIVEGGTYGKRDADTESTEDIISSGRSDYT